MAIQALLQFFDTIAQDASSKYLRQADQSSNPQASQSTSQQAEELTDVEELTDNEQHSSDEDEDDEQKLTQTNAPQPGSMISATAISVRECRKKHGVLTREHKLQTN